MVRFGDAYARIPAALVDEIRARAGADGVCEAPSITLVAGIRVEIQDGVLSGYEAIVTARRGRDRVALLLDVAGHYLSVEAPVEAVRPMA
jgi:hypothetical protein